METQTSETTLAYLERDSEAWLRLKTRCERAHWLDGGLNQTYKAAEEVLNADLEDYYAQLRGELRGEQS